MELCCSLPRRMKRPTLPMDPIANILADIDSGRIALPAFQRGYVWKRHQVRGLFDSLYRGHPVGGLLVWNTESKAANHRGEGPLAAGPVQLLLDGQQRMTSIYGVVRGQPPQFFDGDSRAFTDLRFHLEEEIFEFYQPVKMRDDPLWIDVTELMREQHNGLKDINSALLSRLKDRDDAAERISRYSIRLAELLAIQNAKLHVEVVTGNDKSIDVVVDIFNKVNSGGTKLSKGDLALAKICADWPAARKVMGDKLDEWRHAGYHFTRDWLLRSLNTVLTGEAQFQHLHERSAEEVQNGLERAFRRIDRALDIISGRLGLDHDRVFFGRFAVPVIARYLDRRESTRLGQMDGVQRDKLLFWYVQAAMWGRFSGSTETTINQDIESLEGDSGSLDQLLEQLQLWHRLWAEPTDFAVGYGLGARFYPVLYLLTRMGEAKDWGSGLALKSDLLGKMSKLEVHHIFPKAQLYAQGHSRREVNALANFCFLTKDTNLDIRDRAPEEYFPEVEARHPGALASQWIPDDRGLWTVDRYEDFLSARQELLAKELNRRMVDLLHGDTRWLGEKAARPEGRDSHVAATIEGDEEAQLKALNDWVAEQNLRRGELDYELSDAETGEQKAVFDLAWPDGIQVGLTHPVAVLLNEERDVLNVANEGGYRYFTDIEEFRRYVRVEIHGEDLSDPVAAALANAPMDDEPVTPSEAEAIAEGKRDVAAGRVISEAELRESLGL